MNFKSLICAAAMLSLAAGPVAAQPTQSSPTAAPAPAAAPATSGYTQIAPKGDIISTLQASGQFSTLLKMLDMAGFATPALLRRPQPITLFAPTDAAFAALPAGELTALLQPGNSDQLRARLQYLLFNGPLEYATLQGKAGPVPGAGGSIYFDGAATPNKVNDANLLQADVKAANGHLYVIDKFIATGYTPPPPPAEEPAAPAAPAAQ